MRILRNNIILLLALFSSASSLAQWFEPIDRKGELFGGWGWNRASYTASDIHFTGSNYDFILHDVKAKDRPTAFSPEIYFGLNNLTIPQNNYRIGYFIAKNLALYIGVDHMKYVMIQNQEVDFSGNIDESEYASMVHDERIVLTDNFLTFEHTDGLNYATAELEYYQGIYNNPVIQINAIAGAGAGALVPKSNVKLMGYPRNDEFHLAGFGCSGKLALEFLFWKHFFIRLEYKSGFIDMPDIVTRKASIEDRASQHFFFAQRNGMFGFSIPLVKKPVITETEK